jgi:dCMP deaminase
MNLRPTWNKYFMQLAALASTRSTCLRRQVGAVLVKDNFVLSTGYNGSPARTQHCEDVGCIRQTLNIPSGERSELCRASHAESNAISQAAKHGTPVDGATLYCTHSPCSHCAKLIINSGIKDIIYLEDYPDELSRTLLSEAKIKLTVFND